MALVLVLMLVCAIIYDGVDCTQGTRLCICIFIRFVNILYMYIQYTYTNVVYAEYVNTIIELPSSRV